MLPTRYGSGTSLLTAEAHIVTAMGKNKTAAQTGKVLVANACFLSSLDDMDGFGALPYRPDPDLPSRKSRVMGRPVKFS